MKSTTIAAIALAIATYAGRATHADPLYHVTYLGLSIYPGGAINNLGQVVGTSNSQAVLYNSGQVTYLGTLGGAISGAEALNNVGQIVGQSTTPAAGPGEAFLYSGGTMTGLGGQPGYPGSQATGINDAGTIVGSVSTSNGGASEAFVESGGVMTIIGTGGASGINASGQVVGTTSSDQAFLYSGGAVTYLGVPPGGSQSYATAINNSGEIAGYSYEKPPGSGYVPQAFIYSDGVIQNIGGIEIGNVLLAIPTSINNLGQIVGDTNGSLGSPNRAPFLYTGGSMYNLDNLLDSSGAGLSLELAYGINDSGTILAEGMTTANGYQAVLLTPVPEPSTWVMLMIGAAALLACGLRKRRSPVTHA